MRITYVGHATLLVEIGGRRVLTDPHFEGALARFLPRVSAPGIALEALPPLDALLLTHAHADHLSFETLDRLAPTPPLYAPPAVAAWLRTRGYEGARGLAPGSSVAVGGVQVHAAAATHVGSRYGVDRWRGAANMYLLDSGDVTCFFAGDTALTPATSRLVHERVTSRGRRLDVALLPIGHAPRWKLASFRRGHLTWEDTLALFEQLGARFLVPYHWGTFDHVWTTAYDAIDRLRAALPGYARRADVRILEPGEALDLAVEGWRAE